MGNIHNLVERVKNDEMSREELSSIYEKYKRHPLTEEEKLNIDSIVKRIKSGELTEDILMKKAMNWLLRR